MLCQLSLCLPTYSPYTHLLVHIPFAGRPRQMSTAEPKLLTYLAHRPKVHIQFPHRTNEHPLSRSSLHGPLSANAAFPPSQGIPTLVIVIRPSMPSPTIPCHAGEILPFHLYYMPCPHTRSVRRDMTFARRSGYVNGLQLTYQVVHEYKLAPRTLTSQDRHIRTLVQG